MQLLAVYCNYIIKTFWLYHYPSGEDLNLICEKKYHIQSYPGEIVRDYSRRAHYHIIKINMDVATPGQKKPYLSPPPPKKWLTTPIKINLRISKMKMNP